MNVDKIWTFIFSFLEIISNKDTSTNYLKNKTWLQIKDLYNEVKLKIQRLSYLKVLLFYIHKFLLFGIFIFMVTYLLFISVSHHLACYGSEDPQPAAAPLWKNPQGFNIIIFFISFFYFNWKKGIFSIKDLVYYSLTICTWAFLELFFTFFLFLLLFKSHLKILVVAEDPHTAEHRPEEGGREYRGWKWPPLYTGLWRRQLQPLQPNCKDVHEMTSF